MKSQTYRECAVAKTDGDPTIKVGKSGGPHEFKRQYNHRFNLELAEMSVDGFLKWNPHFTVAEAEHQISQAKIAVQSHKSSPLGEEVDARLELGASQITIKQFVRELKALGYKFDRRHDCHSRSRYLTGPRAGCSYPACNMYPVQIDDGKSAWNHDARRDVQFEALQALRNNVFAVSKGVLFEF